MAYAEVEDGRIVVQTEYRDKDLIRAVPGARYDTNRHSWTVSLTWASCLVLRGVFRERLDLGPILIEWASKYREEFVLPAMRLREQIVSTDPDLETLYPRLYGYQHAGVEFLRHVRRALLTDDMGTGKTAQTIHTTAANIRREEAFPAIVVCPNSMKHTWRNQFDLWWQAPRVEVLEGGRVQRLKTIDRVKEGKAEVLIVNWEGIRGHSRLAPYGSIRLRHCHVCDRSLRDDPDTYAQSKCERCRRELNDISWITAVADEAHRAKDPSSKQTRALWALRTEETEFRYALTGTPIADNPQDLWSALHFIDPLQWPTRGPYIDRYCLMSFNPFGGNTVIGLHPSTRDEFFAITDPHVRRMPKALVLSQLPEKVYSTRYVEMAPKQAKAYHTMQKDMVSLLGASDDQTLVAANPLTKLIRLTQFASAFAEIDEDDDVRLSDPSCKIDGMMEIIEELNGKSLVVFAQQRQLIDLAAARLEKAGIKYGRITGAENAAEKQMNVDNFQKGKFQVIIGTIAAGGVGITLTKADTLLRLQRSWSQVDNKQAEDRVHRIGSEVHESITIIDLVSRDTIEEAQLVALEAKSDRMEEIVRDRQLIHRLVKSGEMPA